MGLLDDSSFSDGGYGPWNAFYPSPLQGDASAVPLPQPRPPGAGTQQPDGTIAIGGYQMPQFGAAPLGGPSQTGGSVQPGAAAPPAPSDNGPGLGDRLSASVNAFANSRAFLPALVNGVTSFATGQRTDPTGAAANQTVQALQARGVSAADAQAAVNNPAIMKALINQVYGSPVAAPAVASSGSALASSAPASGDGSATAPAAATAPTLLQRPRVQLPWPQTSPRGVTQGGIRWGTM